MKIKEYPLSIFNCLMYELKKSSRIAKPLGNELDLVVSLTAIPSRFSSLHLTLKSVLAQSPKPKRIYLWVNNEHLKLIPNKIKALEGDILRIKPTPLTTAHKKLIHTLKAEPQLPIVTCDDDVLYRKNWLNFLYQDYLSNPNKVIAHRVRCIKYDEKGKLLPYKEWICKEKSSSRNRLAIGVEGVLYPPNTFDELVQNQDLFMKLAPKSDDLWFKAVQLVKGVEVKKSDKSPEWAIPIPGTQKISLKNHNVKKDMNHSQWLALSNYFGLELS